MVFLLFVLFLFPPAPQGVVPDTVDFRYAPPRWLSPLGMPDDWHKSLVDDQGRLAYDFGPGPYARPTTLVHLRMPEGIVHQTSQHLANPRVPVVTTEGVGDTFQFRQEAFTLIPETTDPTHTEETVSAVRRTNGYVGTVAWATPPEPVDPAFRNVAWGTGREIRYEIDVAPGSRKRVALGFCDSYRTGRVKRLMDLRIEGAPTRTLDLLETGSTNEPQAFFFDAHDQDGDGVLHIVIAAAAATQDPNVFVSGLWVFAPEATVSTEDVIRGAATPQAEVYVDAGQEPQVQQRGPRVDAIRATIEGVTQAPVLEVTSRRRFAFEASTGVLHSEGRPFLASRPAAIAAQQTARGWLLTLPEGTTQVEAIVIQGYQLPEDIATVPDLETARERVVQYWQETVTLPWDRIQIPVPDIQALLDASIRILYQTRDVVDGLPQFQPGATVYRGLWAGDGAWAVEAATLVGDTTAARLMVDAIRQHQQDNGRVMVMSPPLLHRETAHLLWATCRYARLVGDTAWLERQWPDVERSVSWIAHLREEASQDPEAPYYGLLPPGLTDGGVPGLNATYGSTYWALIAMHEAVTTARWLGKTETALHWQAMYDDFMATFRRAAARDRRQDTEGNWYLPIRMHHDPNNDLPQRGQWGAIHAAFPGALFDSQDPLLQGILAMLDARTVEDHVVSLGWLTGGLWPIFDAHRALTYLWLGDAAKAQRILYAFANHAAPVMVWVEEQMPQGEGTRTTGDVPHTMGNVQVIRTVRHFVAMERENTLDLLAGVPESWLTPGAHLRLDALPTLFGPLTLEMRINDVGTGGTIRVDPVGISGHPGGPVLHLDALKRLGYAARGGQDLPDRWGGTWGESLQIDFER